MVSPADADVNGTNKGGEAGFGSAVRPWIRTTEAPLPSRKDGIYGGMSGYPLAEPFVLVFITVFASSREVGKRVVSLATLAQSMGSIKKYMAGKLIRVFEYDLIKTQYSTLSQRTQKG